MRDGYFTKSENSGDLLKFLVKAVQSHASVCGGLLNYYVESGPRIKVMRSNKNDDAEYFVWRGNLPKHPTIFSIWCFLRTVNAEKLMGQKRHSVGPQRSSSGPTWYVLDFGNPFISRLPAAIQCCHLQDRTYIQDVMHGLVAQPKSMRIQIPGHTSCAMCTRAYLYTKVCFEG
ncbi:hypothetical protein ACLOJK_011554 [Asimina triloba]